MLFAFRLAYVQGSVHMLKTNNLFGVYCLHYILVFLPQPSSADGYKCYFLFEYLWPKKKRRVNSVYRSYRKQIFVGFVKLVFAEYGL